MIMWRVRFGSTFVAMVADLLVRVVVVLCQVWGVIYPLVHGLLMLGLAIALGFVGLVIRSKAEGRRRRGW